jgi:hypothetical protein
VTQQVGVIPVRRDPYVCDHRRENGPIFGRERVRLSSQASKRRAGITCVASLASTVSAGPRLLGAPSARAIFR